MKSSTDKLARSFLDQACLLALEAAGNTSPNPLVGCIIAERGKILSTGFHTAYGMPHAEVEALRKLSGIPIQPETTLYVTLEPCAHFGKTPPCTEAIIESGIKNVVIGCIDRNPLVSGKGISRLIDAGVCVNIVSDYNDASFLNRRFFCSQTLKRPFFIAKWAQTIDGFIAGPSKLPVRITGPHSNKLSHSWRATEDAILIGAGTALADNPQLTTRLVRGRNPVRILLDGRLTVPEDSHIFNASSPTLVFSTVEPSRSRRRKHSTVEYIKLSCSCTKTESLCEVASILHDRRIQSVIVEGGALVLNSFFKSSLVDEIRVFTSPHTLKEGEQRPSRCNDESFSVLTKDIIARPGEENSGDVLTVWYRNTSPYSRETLSKALLRKEFFTER